MGRIKKQDQIKKFLRLAPSISPEKIRLKEETRLKDALKNDEDLMKRLEPFTNLGTIRSVRLGLLQNALHITPEISPLLHNASKIVGEILGLTSPPELFTGISGSLDEYNNAWAVPSQKGRHFYAYIDSSLVERCEPEEILFILGHEIGHCLLSHHLFPSHISDEDPNFSKVEFMELMKLSRRGELSADRCGMLCVQDFEIASKAIFKMTCGLSDKWVQFKGTWYMQQLKELDILSEEIDDLDTACKTHPSPLIRARAIWEFSKSSLYSELLGRSNKNGSSNEEMEKILDSLLSGTDTALLEELKSKNTSQIEKSFLMNAGVLLCADDNGKIKPKDKKVLFEMITEPFGNVENEIESVMEKATSLYFDALLKACDKNADILFCKLSEKQRVLTFNQLLYLSSALQKSEKVNELLQMFQEMLQISNEVIDETNEELRSEWESS